MNFSTVSYINSAILLNFCYNCYETKRKNNRCGEECVLFPEEVVDVDDLSEFNCVSCMIIDGNL